MPGTDTRYAELRAIFADRPRVVDLGQFTPEQRNRLQWGVRRGYATVERAPWPGPIVGTCLKRWYTLQTPACVCVVCGVSFDPTDNPRGCETHCRACCEG